MIIQYLLNLLFIPVILAGAGTTEPHNEPAFEVPRLHDCHDLESEKDPDEWNMLGLDHDADMAICAANVFGVFRDTAPWSEFVPKTIILFEDGSISTFIRTKGKLYAGGYRVEKVSWCALPEMGCTE